MNDEEIEARLKEIQEKTKGLKKENKERLKEIQERTTNLLTENDRLKKENKEKLTVKDILQKLETIKQTPQEKPILIDINTHFEKFLEHRKKFDQIGEDTIRTTKSSFEYLQYFSSKDTNFNFSFFKELQKNLQNIPKNFYKYEKYYKKSFKEILKLKKTEDYETLHNKTINNHMSKYKTFFNYLIYEEIIKDNPLLNIKPLKIEKTTKKEEYTKKELDNIFSSDIEKIYLNMCKVALYLGLRIEEVLSIKKEDIRDNLVYINLEDKTTKKHTRTIPIHKNLQSIIQEQSKTNKGDYLFFIGNSEKEVKNVGKRVNRRLKSIVQSDIKTFHSLRKNFSQEIELNTNAEEKIKKYLMGHSLSKDITHMIYNREQINNPKLEECINQITFKY